MENTYEITKQRLREVELPEHGKYYKPVLHKDLMDLTLEAIKDAGFTLDKEQYTSARKGNIATGRYTIKDFDDGEMRLQINWINSLDKSKALNFSLGVGILICGNGAIRGNFSGFKKKHIGEIQEFTPKAIVEYIRYGEKYFKQLQEDKKVLKEVILDNNTRNRLIGQMFLEEDFITATQMSNLKREIERPTFDYKCDQNSLWNIYQGATFSMTNTHPSDWMDSHIKAHDFFCREANILMLNPPSINIPLDISPRQLNLPLENVVE